MNEASGSTTSSMTSCAKPWSSPRDSVNKQPGARKKYIEQARFKRPGNRETNACFDVEGIAFALAPVSEDLWWDTANLSYLLRQEYGSVPVVERNHIP